MNAKCKFIYNGHTGPRGKVCGRPESDHCPEKYAYHGLDVCSLEHHSFTRMPKCSTCGCTINHVAKGKRRNA